SLSRELPVLELILERFPATLYLALCSILVGCAIAFPLGIFSAKNRGSLPDTAAMVFAMAGMSVPIFVLAPITVLFFSIRLRWFPVAGFGGLEHVFLPALCLGVGL